MTHSCVSAWRGTGEREIERTGNFSMTPLQKPDQESIRIKTKGPQSPTIVEEPYAMPVTHLNKENGSPTWVSNSCRICSRTLLLRLIPPLLSQVQWGRVREVTLRTGIDIRWQEISDFCYHGLGINDFSLIYTYMAWRTYRKNFTLLGGFTSLKGPHGTA